MPDFGSRAMFSVSIPLVLKDLYVVRPLSLLHIIGAYVLQIWGGVFAMVFTLAGVKPYHIPTSSSILS